MKAISRHAIDAELAQERVESEAELLEDMLDIATQRAGALSSVVSSARAYAGYLVVTNAETSQICRALRIGAQAAGALFALGHATGEVEFTLGDRRLKLPATGPNDATHVAHWRTGWWLATIVRDEESIDRLASTPIDVLRRSTTKGDECQYRFAEALQLYERRAPGWSDKLEAALDATDPATTKLIDEDYVLNILVPEMQMIFRHAIGEIAPFEQAFEFALERHRRYWSKPERERDPDGFLAIGPIALAGLAVDAGVPIECESGYAPSPLIEGACRPQ
jgi:hypothetical protein